MKKLDTQEYHIVRHLIRNPRSSDNEISRKTGIPLRTVNRKRKALEEKQLLSYFTYLHTFNDGLAHFKARSLVTLKFKQGITRSMALSAIEAKGDFIAFNSKHVLESHLGENNGHIVWVMILESMHHVDIVEIINAEMIPVIERVLGSDSVIESNVIELTTHIRMLHNYLPSKNMEKGKISDDWDNKYIYVT